MSNGRLALLGSGLILVIIASLAALEAIDKHAYYLLVQEDGVLEWATVVLMLPATWLCLQGARRMRADGARLPWFFAGLMAFCVFFAGEEISWGQRLMAYQPPEYFLENNSQQELNVHNLFKKYVRTKYLLMGILGLYGVLLPLLSHFVAPIRALTERLGVIVPPVLLVPGFAATGLLIYDYPWKYTGEVAECLFSLALYLTIALKVEELPTDVQARFPLAGRVAATVGGAAVLALLIPPVLGVVLHGSDEERTGAAAAEIEALVADWHAHAEAEGRGPSRCGTHIRLFTWVRKHDYELFREGAFAALDTDEVRRRYFLDPWNNPYWVRHVCKKKRTRGVFIYSFGPNSQRDSTKKALAPDDIGVEFMPR